MILVDRKYLAIQAASIYYNVKNDVDNFEDNTCIAIFLGIFIFNIYLYDVYSDKLVHKQENTDSTEYVEKKQKKIQVDKNKV